VHQNKENILFYAKAKEKEKFFSKDLAFMLSIAELRS